MNEKWLPIAGVSVVVMLHAGVIAGLLHGSHAKRSTNGASPVFVGFVAGVPRLAQMAAPPSQAVRPQHRDRPAERSPRNSKAETISPPGPVEPSPAPPVRGAVDASTPSAGSLTAQPADAVERPADTLEPHSRAAPTPEETGPMEMPSELSVSCPERPAPPYPPMARRLRELGSVTLRVELDETGRIVAATVVSSSSFKRLDEAALASLRTWRCNPPQRDGRPSRAVALQSFKFTLEGS